ncbi:MAG: sulfatase [Gemmatimonadetes bacterium]|nr:sulfatase [Gemmatimonadota bacterium]
MEAAVLVGGMALLPRRPWSRALAWPLAAGVVLVAAVSFADLVFRASLGRALDLSLDLYLLDAVYRLALGNTGFLRTVLGIGALIALVGLSVLLTAWLLTPTSRDGSDRDRRLVPRFATGMLAAAVALGLVGLGVPAVGNRVVAPAASLLLDQAALFRSMRQERAVFAADLASQPRRFADVSGLFSSLEGRNVVVAYIESYGTAAIEDPQFAAVTRPVLEAAAARFDTAGLHIATGRLASPTLGGQSWYAHGTMLSGLWLENQLRYELLLASERETLVDDFRRAGYRTATVMPAITMAWPQATRIGYDDVYTQPTIPYAGPPFYWVTMPDQFTWSFLAGRLREATTPLFVEVGMVSSHAPWIPVLPIVDWDAVGDGAVFTPYRLDGYPPEELWWDVAVLREGYARSLAYSLEAMAQFAERYLDERTLLIVLGDHQAAPWVTGASGADVPVHVITTDPTLLEPFLEWGFRPGALPAPEPSTARMDAFREWFVLAFSRAPGA